MKWIILVLCNCCIASLASIQVNVCDPATLEAYGTSDIMMGMDVAIVVCSDSNDVWSGGIFIEGPDRAFGTLTARGKDPNSRDWALSHLPAAGIGAQVIECRDSLRWGFDLYTDDLERQTGPFFVVDYNSLQPGTCHAAFYDYGRSWTQADPNLSITFYTSPTRDLVPDGIVNYADFSVFSLDWQRYTGTDPNYFSAADFSMDGLVDLVDLCMFTDYWMYGVPGWKPRIEPSPEPAQEPNITYSIHDSNMSSEITLFTGQSITLYIDQLTAGEYTYVIDLEAMISDPNLGWIDNTPIDPNNPPGWGTARLLFVPRDTFFDHWGPGVTQPEGIEFVAASLTNPIPDGAIASFVYTAQMEGTVTLDICDYVSYSNLESITIHQVAQQETLNINYEPDTMMLSSMNASVESTILSEPESSNTLQSDQTVETVVPLSPAECEELADFLEDIWQTDKDIRLQIDKSSWDEFVDSVRNSYEQ